MCGRSDLAHFTFPSPCSFVFQALAMESPAYYPSVCKRALKSALTLHRKQEAIDAVRVRLVFTPITARRTEAGNVHRQSGGYVSHQLAIVFP